MAIKGKGIVLSGPDPSQISKSRKGVCGNTQFQLALISLWDKEIPMYMCGTVQQTIYTQYTNPWRTPMKPLPHNHIMCNCNVYGPITHKCNAIFMFIRAILSLD